MSLCPPTATLACLLQKLLRTVTRIVVRLRKRGFIYANFFTETVVPQPSPKHHARFPAPSPGPTHATLPLLSTSACCTSIYPTKAGKGGSDSLIIGSGESADENACFSLTFPSVSMGFEAASEVSPHANFQQLLRLVLFSIWF